MATDYTDIQACGVFVIYKNWMLFCHWLQDTNVVKERLTQASFQIEPASRRTE
jgi:hypothetical protein